MEKQNIKYCKILKKERNYNYCEIVYAEKPHRQTQQSAYDDNNNNIHRWLVELVLGGRRGTGFEKHKQNLKKLKLTANKASRCA